VIGLFGIVADEATLSPCERAEAFSLMMACIEKRDFHNTVLVGKHFCVGLTQRNIGDNQDMSLKLIRDSLLIGFCGYGKFRGDAKLCWAEEMIDRILPIYEERGKDTLKEIEGSFCCLIVQASRLIFIGDRVSSKNSFYYKDDQAFIFAPDVGRVIESGLVPKEKNLDAAKQVLISGFFLDDATLAKGVQRFPYGSLMTGNIIRPLKLDSERYWDIPATEGTIDQITPSLIEEFSGRLQQTIYRLADLEEKAIVPLSGGLDSRVIAYYLSKRQHLNALTYDLGDEVRLARKVSDALQGSWFYFSNTMLDNADFRQALKGIVQEQRIHAVLNQYFYAPLFRDFFSQDNQINALYDGVYLDILFSAPYTYQHFEKEDFIKVYGNSAQTMGNYFKNWENQQGLQLLESIFSSIQHGRIESDAVGRSQGAYFNGRLRRYVIEFLSFKEDYAYAFKPGFDYDLMDFGYNLSLRLRRGVLYQGLFNTLQEIKDIPFKDSYGIRKDSINTKLKRKYVNLRLRLSSATSGLLPYFLYQTEWLFLGRNLIDDYEKMFLSSNCISEFFDNSELEALFQRVKKKQYVFNMFQRVLFLQQFYRRYGF